MYKILLIDDDTEVLSINKRYFSKEGYEVKATVNAINAIKLLGTYHPDCIIMDIMMPGLNGFEACRRIKSISDAPIIFLTGCSSEDDKINGLLIGADDYILKPYSLRELSARIKVQIRKRFASPSNSTTIIYPPLLLDLALHKAYYNEEEIPLTNKEYELLYLLASKPGQVITFETIGKSMWGSYIDNDRRTIMVTASRLRKKLEDYVGLSEFVETVWSKGYKFSVRSGGDNNESYKKSNA